MTRLGATSAVAVLLIAGFPVQAEETPTVQLGVDAAGAAELAAAGTPPALASFWVGDWMADSGWGALEGMLSQSQASGRTPVLYWYYWGDAISPSCVEQGCNGRTRAQWDALTTTLAQKIRERMGGAATYVVLENEFNKGGITDPSYAPTFDRYLEAKAMELKGVPGVKIVLGYGSWGENTWDRFPRAIAASDAIGFQIMRASTKDSQSTYQGSQDKIASVLDTIQKLAPGKHALLYDLALSSYPDASWAELQKQTLAQILARRGEYAQAGLWGIVYRTTRDNPNMSPANYYGYAERHWGLREVDYTPKPSLAVWTNAFTTAPPAPPPPNAAPTIPVNVEAEAMRATTGGRAYDAKASGGALWNLWSNGELSQRVTSNGGVYRVNIDARGQLAGGVAPVMELRVNGERQGVWSVGTTLATYSTNAAFPSGESTLTVAFTNDAVVGGQDRNLLVDVVRVANAPPNAAPTARIAVTGAGDTWTFDASGSSDPDGDALAFAWAFPDGSATTGARVTKTFAAGSHVVTLTVSDGRGGSDTASATVSATKPAPVALAATFSGVTGNDYWVQTSVSANKAVTSVCAIVDGAGCMPLELKSYGWASSFYVKPGSDVQFRASVGAESVTSGAYDWPSGQPVTAETAGPAPAASKDVKFTPYDGNAYWVQTKTASESSVKAVCASLNGGTCKPLSFRSWGAWATSVSAPTGTKVVFTATLADGTQVKSTSYTWPIK